MNQEAFDKMLGTLRDIKVRLSDHDSFDSLMLFEILDSVDEAITSAESSQG